ncbi:MAG: DoxX family protein [Candidatus Binataceae bacterium]
MQGLDKTGALVGRILIAAIFILSGATKLGHAAGMAGYMAAHHIPGSMAEFLVYVAGIIELAGGLMLVFGFRARIAAIVLFLYLIPVTILFHIMPGGMMNQVNTMKNLAIMGGLLMVASMGPGAFSMDVMRGRS